MNEIIFAPATAIGNAAISIIRVSGDGCCTVLKKLINKQLPKKKVLSLREVYFPKKGHVIDRCLVCWMPKSSSYTGEDSFEIQCHGGIAVMNSFYDALLSFKNVRFAEQGEFTKRAIMNGKINLIHAEAINDLVKSETEQQRILALKQFKGGLSNNIDKWRKTLLKAMSSVEAKIDFSDEDDVPEDILFKESLLTLKNEISLTLENSKHYELIKEGAKVVLTGKANAGKSSLFNFIIKNEKSIVTNIPGTTRDAIEYKINIKGYPVTITDTAGINKTDDIIEIEGIKRAKEQMDKADLILNVIDCTSFGKEEISKKHWNILNKTDKNHIFNIDKSMPNLFKVSAKTGEGVEALMQEIYKFIRFNTKKVRSTEFFHSSQRQRKELENTMMVLEEAIKEKQDEIIAEHLRSANTFLKKIIGEVDIEEVLGEIFSSFCIGK